MKIMIVDFDPKELKLAKALVERLGFEVIAVSDARQACEQLMSDSPPEILLIDWMIPETNGLELCKIIRNTKLPISPCLIVMTASNEDDAEDTALLKGADEFIRKPLSFRSLSAKIRVAKRIINSQLELIKLNEKLSKLALLDDLTGVMNRRAGMSSLHESLARLQRNPGTAAGLVMCDINNFSQIQEENGHAFGDRIIQSFSSKLMSLLRPTDWIARFGGEQFLILIESPINELPSILNRLIRLSSTHTLDSQSHQVDLCLNVSCLWLQSHNAHIPIDELLDKADQLLLKSAQESACSFIIEEVEQSEYLKVVDLDIIRDKKHHIAS